MRTILAGMLLAATAASAPAQKSNGKGDESPAEAIQVALAKSDAFEFTGANLSAVLQTIGDQFKINIVLDRAAVMQLGFEPEVINVEFKMKRGKLRDALKGICGQYNLTFAVVGDTLLVTTEEMAIYKQLKQRVSVDVDNIPLNKALKDLSKRYGVNIVIDPRATKSKAAESAISLQVDDVPLEAVVRLMCELADLKPARLGNVLLVTTEARADRLKDTERLVPAPMPPANPLLPPGIGQ